MKSILQDWVMRLPLRQQGVLIIATRGPDGVRKEDAAKPLVRTMRGLTLNAGRTGAPIPPGVVWDTDTFMTIAPICSDVGWVGFTGPFFDNWDSYNVHFLQHLAHAYAVVGIAYPDLDIRIRAWEFYKACCHKLHMNHESPDQVAHRLRDGIRLEADE